MATVPLLNSLFVLFIIAIIVCMLGCILFFCYKRTRKNMVIYHENSHEVESLIDRIIQQKMKESPKLPNELDGMLLKVKYEDVPIHTPHQEVRSSLEPGKQVVFINDSCDPKNPDAVAVFYGNSKLGYVPQNYIQFLINEYKRKGGTVYGVISYVNAYCTMVHIGFYKKQVPLSECKKRKVYKLLKNTNPDIQNTIRSCKIGQEVMLQYDEIFNVFYAVCNGYIGTFPKLADSFFEMHEPYIFISDIKEGKGKSLEVFVEVCVPD